MSNCKDSVFDQCIRPWRLLDPANSELIQEVLRQWQDLLDNPDTTEKLCLRFLRDHEALLLHQPATGVGDL